MDAVQVNLEIASFCKSRGRRVEFIGGWETRGNGFSANYIGGIVHHTGTLSSVKNPFPSRQVLLNGRPDLDPPLCNWALDWNGTLWVVAANPANHAGASGGRSMGPLPKVGLFNPRVLGLEIDYAGSSPMSEEQHRSAVTWSAGVVSVL